MTKKLEIYKCNVCGNMVEIVLAGVGELVCCEQPMEHLVEKTEKDEMISEKHIPVVTYNDDGIEVKVGSIPHPMEESHYIQFIEVNSKDGKYVKRKYLVPHEEAILAYKCNCKDVIAREFCNIHGLWKKET